MPQVFLMSPAEQQPLLAGLLISWRNLILIVPCEGTLGKQTTTPRVTYPVTYGCLTFIVLMSPASLAN